MAMLISKYFVTVKKGQMAKLDNEMEYVTVSYE